MANGRILKAIYFGEVSGARLDATPGSQRLDEDPFAAMVEGRAIHEPPYNLDQLSQLAEAHPVHSASLEQKTTDIVASGPQFVAEGEGVTDEHLAAVRVWFESLFDEHTPVETLTAVWSDFETLGEGYLEIVPGPDGAAISLYHVPAHTVRVAASGLYVQIRDGRQVWFKKWGDSREYYAATGNPVRREDVPLDKRANAMIMFHKPSRRSSYYGIPGYVSAIGQITLAVAARDYNILFFENNREPRVLVVVEGLAEDDETLLDEIEERLRTQHRDPHRNMLLPLTGDAKLTVERFGGSGTDDLRFERLMVRTDAEILMAHRMPPDRVGSSRAGPLSGSVTSTLNRIYKDGVVSRGQDVLEDRLGRFVRREWTRKTGVPCRVKLDLEELDVNDEVQDSGVVVSLVKHCIITLNEGRKRLRMPVFDPFGDLTMSEFLANLGASDVQPGVAPPPNFGGNGLASAAAAALAAAYGGNGDGELPGLHGLDARLEQLLTGRLDQIGEAIDAVQNELQYAGLRGASQNGAYGS